MSVKHHLTTAEELLEMPDVAGKEFELVNGKIVEVNSGNGNDIAALLTENFELVDGEVVEVAPANYRHGLIIGEVYVALRHHVRQHNLGVVLGDNVGYALRRNPALMRAPDVSFLARESVPEDDELDRFVEGPPTLAVEVVSPNDRAEDVQRRVRDYLDAGTQQVWVLWPKRRAMSVYSPNADTRELEPETQLDGGDVLPGFSVQVGELFNIR